MAFSHAAICGLGGAGGISVTIPARSRLTPVPGCGSLWSQTCSRGAAPCAGASFRGTGFYRALTFSFGPRPKEPRPAACPAWDNRGRNDGLTRARPGPAASAVAAVPKCKPGLIPAGDRRPAAWCGLALRRIQAGRTTGKSGQTACAVAGRMGRKRGLILAGEPWRVACSGLDLRRCNDGPGRSVFCGPEGFWGHMNAIFCPGVRPQSFRPGQSLCMTRRKALAAGLFRGPGLALLPEGRGGVL